jgi:Tfp pilus assembly protein PilF
VYFAAVVLAVAGCVTEEQMKKANGYYQEGLSYVETDQQRAFVSFQKAIQLDPNHKEAHYALGHLYYLKAKYKQAEEQFQEAVRIDSDYSEAHNYLGQTYQRQERWPEAVKAYRKALANPLYATPDKALFNLGKALAHEGDFQGAAQAFEDTLSVSPPSLPPVLVHLELGKTYYKLGYHDKARESLSRVTSLNQGGELAAEAAKLMERLKRSN